MNLVTCNTVAELKTMLNIIFWPSEGTHKDIGEASLELDEIATCLDFSDTEVMAYLHPNVVDQTDEWWEIFDDIDDADFHKWAIEDGQYGPVKDFVPCCVLWRFENGFDRMSSYHIRLYEIIPVSEMTVDYWVERHVRYQQARQAELEAWVQQEARLNGTANELQQPNSNSTEKG